MGLVLEHGRPNRPSMDLYGQGTPMPFPAPKEVKSSDDIAALVDDKAIGETVEAPDIMVSPDNWRFNWRCKSWNSLS